MTLYWQLLLTQRAFVKSTSNVPSFTLALSPRNSRLFRQHLYHRILFFLSSFSISGCLGFVFYYQDFFWITEILVFFLFFLIEKVNNVYESANEITVTFYI